MIKRLIPLLAVTVPCAAIADMNLLREYGVATTVEVCLADYNSPSDFEPGAVFVAGDVLVMKDQGTPANIGTLPTSQGTCYSFPLTSTEMQAARVMVTLIDQSATKVWMDTAVHIDTFGHPSSALPDLGRDAFWQYVLDDSITAEQAVCYMLSVLAGESDFDPETSQSVFQDPAGMDTRVTVAYGDDNGDRVSITLNAANCGSN